jgi:glycosyltransferase involved in cell wall biosynthesis
LQAYNNDDAGRSNWYKLAADVTKIYGRHIPDGFDVYVAGSPPMAIDLANKQTAGKKFFLLQMAEHLFQKDNARFNAICHESYKVPFPIIGISRWVEYVVRTDGGRGRLPMYYIGNGVSDDFKPPRRKPDELTLLVEGWETYGTAKDVDKITQTVVRRLREDTGCRVIAYSQFPLRTNPELVDEYYEIPTQEQLVEINQRAHVMLKASLLDARSCAPMEAIACGAVPVRAIHHGDDDLLHLYNCLRCEYDAEALYQLGIRALTDAPLRAVLAANGQEYRKRELSWAYWAEKLEQIFEEG